MSDVLYLHDNTAIINFNNGFPTSLVQILNSDTFAYLLNTYLNTQNNLITDRLKELSPSNDYTLEILNFLRVLHVYDYKDIDHPFTKDKSFVLNLIEDIYSFWRSYQRCSIIYYGKKSTSEFINFIDRDSEFNRFVLTFYRNFQEKVIGRSNKIYRQLHAGTNASMILTTKQLKLPEKYVYLKGFPVIDATLQHSPLILHPKTQKREGHFKEELKNPFLDLKLNKDHFICYPAKIGKLLALVYVHRDFIFSALSLSNIYELATSANLKNNKPDIIIIFGIKDNKETMSFHYDKEENMVVGKISYQNKIEYFGYLKKIMLTCFNVYMIHQDNLPIHGAMINVYLKNGNKYGIVFMGDSGAGKSEIIEEISNLGLKTISHLEVVFDDMGVFRFNDTNEIIAQGTEIGAFVRLDDLDRGLPYQQMDRSIFMNPESANNARVIVPVSNYELITLDHKIDYFFYANNYSEEVGVKFFNDYQTMSETFIQGKRFAKNTTHEKGLTTSYFANPFGPLQLQEICDPLIEKYLLKLLEQGVKIGEVYTNLALPNNLPTALKKSAQAVLKLLK